MKGEIVMSPEHDFLPIESVFALRALALGVVGKQARRWLDTPKTSGFALYEATGASMGSDRLERYLGVIAKRPAYDYWQMTISFRETRLSEQTRYSNVLVQNRFNWNRQGRCVGSRVVRSVYGAPVGFSDGEQALARTRDYCWWPLDASDLVDITDELQLVSSSIDTGHLRQFALRSKEGEAL